MKVVGVKFRDQGRFCDYDSTGFTLKERDIVVVDTERGPELAFVARMPMERDPQHYTKPLRKVIRLADQHGLTAVLVPPVRVDPREGKLVSVWMLLAANLLSRSSAPLARIAEDVGYQTDTAFSRAFRREYGARRQAGR